MMTDIPVLSASANDRLSIERLADGGARISNESGSAIVPAHAITPLRETFLDLAAMPHLTPPDFTWLPVTDDVELALCSEGPAIITVGRGPGPRRTVQIERGDFGKVARALS